MEARAEDRDRRWRRWVEIDEALDFYTDTRAAETPVVIFESRDA